MEECRETRATGDQMTKSLEKLKTFTLRNGFDFLEKNLVISSKRKDYGFTYYARGLVHDVKIEDCLNNFKMHGTCWQSERKDESYDMTILFQPFSMSKSVKVVGAHCTCYQGIHGACSHIPALFYYLSFLIETKCPEIPDDQDCLLQPTKSETFDVIDSDNCEEFEQSTEFYVHSETAESLSKRIKVFKDVLLKCEPPGAMAYNLNGDARTVMTDLGTVQEFSPLHNQLMNPKLLEFMNFKKQTSTTQTDL